LKSVTDLISTADYGVEREGDRDARRTIAKSVAPWTKPLDAHGVHPEDIVPCAPSRPFQGMRKTSPAVREGLFAGLIGAMTIALWFCFSTRSGGVLLHANILGATLFGRRRWTRHRRDAPNLHGGRSVVHVDPPARFSADRIAASRLLAVAEREPNAAFGILLLFVVFEAGFLGLCMVLAEPELHEMAWPEALGGNLLAAAAMTMVFWRRHPALAVEP